jgi:hypothetical protein
MFQQFAVAQAGTILQKHGSANVLHGLAHLAGRHVLCPRNGIMRPYIWYFPGRRDFLHFFSPWD